MLCTVQGISLHLSRLAPSCPKTVRRWVHIRFGNTTQVDTFRNYSEITFQPDSKASLALFSLRFLKVELDSGPRKEEDGVSEAKMVIKHAWILE
mmetsp:Transcript_7633/g.11181  ORF Transcript_7633/g.11181 Transcript_7633/m.11181 type:complete len:94 (-) Transcript_7633:47-328(-)